MSLPASAADPALWRPRDALTAVLFGLAAAIATSLPFGSEPSAGVVFGIIVPAQSLATIAAVVYMSRRRSWEPGFFGVEVRDALGLLTGAGLQIGLSIIAYWIVVELFGGDVPTQEVVDAAAEAIGAFERILVVVGVVVLGPIAEELVFRGILLSGLRRRFSDGYAVLWSAAAFGALHLLDPNAVFAVPFLFAVGLMMGRVVIRTGRLVPAIAIHMGFNLLSVLALFAT